MTFVWVEVYTWGNGLLGTPTFRPWRDRIVVFVQQYLSHMADTILESEKTDE